MESGERDQTVLGKTARIVGLHLVLDQHHLPMALGFIGAWSVPIKSVAGTILGTVDTYFATAGPYPERNALR